MLAKLGLSFQIKKLKNVKKSNNKLRNSIDLLNVSKIIQLKMSSKILGDIFICFIDIVN